MIATFSLAIGAVPVSTILASAFLHKFVEKPFIDLGRLLINAQTEGRVRQNPLATAGRFPQTSG
jgi:peptidoglycan/LPS O-acetylase OafA/YrhL